ncbi:MAG: AraC family transcriptional regulator [Acidobacteria bacterium]|nr:AraC family transcriptional regulator [Acidobacteriota bacterium]
MSRPVPIFRDPSSDGTYYEADSCRPLADAVARGDVALHALKHGHYPGRALPAGSLAGLKTAGFWDAEETQSWGLDWHRNEGIEITFVESGAISFASDEKEQTLQPDSLTITRPWQRHRLGNPNVGPGRLHWVILDVGVRRPNQHWRWPDWILLSRADRDELAAVLRQTGRLVWKASSEIRHCFLALAAAVQAAHVASSLSALTIRINELLLLLLEMLRRRRPQLDEALTSSRAAVRLFLDDLARHPEHLALEWTVEQMAESCGLGVTQFVHITRQLTNLTPRHYLNQCRLRQASDLLRGEMSITEIAQQCGFTSSQYFATAFRREYGCAPTARRGFTCME